MTRITIRPVWTIQDERGQALPPRLIELLVQVHGHGSLLAAAQQLGLSYRHAWDLVRQGEAQFGAPLLHMERGRGSTLSALGDKLAWADQRIGARLKPALDSLASELATEIQRTREAEAPALRLHASHGFAIEKLVERLAADGQRVELTYGSSTASAAALHDGACDAAGFHIPEGAMQAAALAHYARWLAGEALTVMHIARRRQGLMVAAGNPLGVTGLADLLRPGLRFVNRQAGSGTRFLLEGLLAAEGMDPARIGGWELGEYTHAAVAAYVASGMADVGFGLEPPARHFRLDFLPLASERYFLLCRSALVHTPALQRVQQVLQDPAFRAVLAALPGYDGSGAGETVALDQAFPSDPGPRPAAR